MKMVVRKMKEKCKDAARMRREKERTEFNELSKLLPLPTSTTSQLDKASIIRLTSSYLRMRSAFPEGLGANWGTRKSTTSFSSSSSNCNARVASSSSSAASASSSFDNDVANHYHANSADGDERDSSEKLQQHQQQLQLPTAHNKCNPTNHLSAQLQPHSNLQNQHQQPTIKELGSLILQTLDGFVFALHRDGKIMYISETASVLLGLPQIDLTGSSIFDYVHPADHNDLLAMLSLNDEDRNEIQAQTTDRYQSSTMADADQQAEHLELGRSFSLRMKCILPKRNAGLIKNGYKSIHCTGYLKVRRVQKQPDKSCSQTVGLDWDSYALVAVGHSLLPTASTEIKLNRNSFMFRANLDMKIYYMEATAIYSLGHQQNNVAGQSLYQLIHLADSQHLEEAHRSLLSKGQVVSKYFRLMRRDTGYIWVQMQASLINNPRSMPKPLHVVGICTMIGDNHTDQSRLLLEQPIVVTSQDESYRVNNLHVTQMEHAASQRRKIMKTHSSSNSLLTIKEHTKLVGNNHKRAAAKRKDKSILPMKRIRHSSGNGNNKFRILDENDHEGGLQIRQAQSMITERSALSIDHYGQSIGLMRRPSDDTCSVASSSVSTSASSLATTISSAAPITMPCPPPSVSSCSSSSSNCSSSSSLSTPRTSNAVPPSSLYLPDRFHQMASRPLDSIDSFVQIEQDEVSFCQQTQLQQCYPLPVDNQHSSDAGQIYSDHTQYQPNSYWTLASDKIHCHAESSQDCSRPIAEQQSNHAISEQYYYSINGDAVESDNQLAGYYQYNNSSTSFYNGPQHFNPQAVGFKSGMNIENSMQATQYQYHYPTSGQPDCEAVSMTTPANVAPTATPCFVGSNQSF